MAPMHAKLLLSLATVGLSVLSIITPASATQAVLSLAASEWIWTPTATALAEVALRKDFSPLLGRSLIAAEIVITAATNMNLYVNGEYIGSESAPARWGYAQRFCVDLLPSFNVFAVNASTVSTSTIGFIATILVTYSDGTVDTIVSDTSWRVFPGSPAGFERLEFDDTAWLPAISLRAYTNAGLYEVIIPSDPPVLTFFSAGWVWTAGISATAVPPGSRAFRRTFTPAEPDTHDAYTLYVNGAFIGNGTNAEVVLAVLATNVGTQASTAGVLVSIEVNMQPSGRTNCTAGSMLTTDAIPATDAVWVSTLDAIPAGFEQPGFDDSTWSEVQAVAGNAVTIAAASAPITI
ncbi:hypothetical protein B0H16DRAFT_1712711 [Mycena metata]|uniref:Uncharacterized protein n=1 Tax=Mycena metata TaxID=1033252 RepID=A0AAD7K5Y8_9AGAR|nr:hypothetical protein B0H16DRAFT_1712711 [Mycena metata]